MDKCCVLVSISFNLLQEMADEPKAQDQPGKDGKEWRTSGEWSRSDRKTREKDEHFLHATGKNTLKIKYYGPLSSSHGWHQRFSPGNPEFKSHCDLLMASGKASSQNYFAEANIQSVTELSHHIRTLSTASPIYSSADCSLWSWRIDDCWKYTCDIGTPWQVQVSVPFWVRKVKGEGFTKIRYKMCRNGKWLGIQSSDWLEVLDCSHSVDSISWMMIVCRLVEDYRYITTDILCIMYNLWFTVLYTIIRVVLTGELMYSLHCYVRLHVGF